MNNLQIFKNNDFGEIRTIEIDNEIWFVGKDVAIALGYANSSKAVSNHVDNDDKIFEMIAHSQNGNMVKTQTALINESGLYSLIFGSKLETAKKFKNWVTKEVLPSIRQTGSYDINNLEERVAPMIFNGILAGIKQVAIENDKKIDTRFNQIEDKLDKKYKKQDEQFQEMKNMIGFKAKNTRMLSKLLKIKLSELKGYNVNAYNYDYRTIVTRLFSMYDVEKWEDIPIAKFNEVHAMIDGIESMDDVYTWNN